MDISRRRVLGTTGALGAAAVTGALTASPAHAAGKTIPAATSPVPVAKRAWSTYGEWSSQADVSMRGRYDPLGVREMPGALGTYELICRYDRAHVDQCRALGVTDLNAAEDSAWRGAAWCGEYHFKASGMVEAELTMPAAHGIGFALMIWPDDDSQWPYGEVNIAEGQTGSGHIMTNVHWGTLDNRQHDPALYDIDVTKKHRYGVKVSSGQLDFTIDGTVIRTLKNPQVPYLNPSHLVLQLGADKINEVQVPAPPYADDYFFRESFIFTPTQLP